MDTKTHSQPHKVNWSLFLLLLFAFFLTQRINHSLTPYNIYLFIPAPFIIVAVLFFTPPFSLLYLLIYTLLFDATIPQSVNGLLGLFFIAYLLLANFQLNPKLVSYKKLWIVTQFANVCLFLITNMLFYKSDIPLTGYIIRLTTDFLCSQLFLAVFSHLLFTFLLRDSSG